MAWVLYLSDIRVCVPKLTPFAQSHGVRRLSERLQKDGQRRCRLRERRRSRRRRRRRRRIRTRKRQRETDRAAATLSTAKPTHTAADNQTPRAPRCKLMTSLKRHSVWS